VGALRGAAGEGSGDGLQEVLGAPRRQRDRQQDPHRQGLPRQAQADAFLDPLAHLISSSHSSSFFMRVLLPTEFHRKGKRS